MIIIILSVNNYYKVSFCVVSDVELFPSKFDTNYKSVIVFGKAKEVLGEKNRWFCRFLCKQSRRN